MYSNTAAEPGRPSRAWWLRSRRGGLVVREPDESDGRVTWVRATTLGREMMERGRAARIEQISAMLGRLEPLELEVLDRSVASLERLMGELSFADPTAESEPG